MSQVYFTAPELSCGIHQLADICSDLCDQLRYDYAAQRFVTEKVDRKKGIKNILTLVASQKARHVDDDAQYFDNCAFLLFSDAVSNKAGRYLADYIKRHKLGSLVQTKKKKNPNSGAYIEAWLWGVDWVRLDAHLAKLGVTVDDDTEEVY